tara:strand:- start:2454 stop:2963 length:510 start_codon:yes stop_codon:yes gene_type:complete
MKKTIYIFAVISLIFVSCKKEEGCTDPVAANYNSDAENDDGSCIFDLVGVWNPESVDYNINVTATLAGQTIYSMDTSYTSTPQDTSWDIEGNMEFTSSGTLITSDETQNYTTSGNTLTITESDGEESEATYTVSKTNLSITIVDSETETDMMGVTNVINYEMTINATRQ